MFKNLIIKDHYIYLIYFVPISFILGQSAVSLNFFFISLFTFLIFFFDKLNFKKIFDSNTKLIFLFFFLIFFIQIILYGVNGFKYFLLIRFLAITCLLKYYFLKNDLNIFFNKYFKILTFIFIFIFIDLIIQRTFGIDIFGYKSTIETNINRLTGPFGNNEYIPGSYIFHICLPAVIYFICNFYNKNFFLKLLIIIVVMEFLLLGIFITGERTSFMMAFLSIILFAVIKKNLRLEIIVSLIITTLTIIYITNKNSYYKERYLIFLETVVTKKNTATMTNNSNFFNSQWGAHYLTSIEIFKSNILRGSGVRSFRIECGNDKYNNIKSESKDIRCSTHPHNFYLEILSETGILSFIIFIIYLVSNIVSSVKLLSSKKEFVILVSFFVVFISMIWPLRATGSIFSNFAGSMMWLNFAFISAINFKLFQHNQDNYNSIKI
jgi:O-antigen ligase